MSQYLDIVELTRAVLEKVAAEDTVKVASSEPASPYQTDVGKALAEAVELLKSAESPDITYADLIRVAEMNIAEPAVAKHVPGREVGNALRKIAADLKNEETVLNATRQERAQSIKRAAIGIEHLTRGLK